MADSAFDIFNWFGGNGTLTSACHGSEGGRDFSFDPEDEATRSYLTRVGIPEHAIASGGVDRSELKAWGVDPDVFALMAGMMPPETAEILCPADDAAKFLSHAEAVNATLLANNVRDPAKEAILFKSGDCLSGWSAVTVLGNYNERAFEPNLNGDSGVTPESSCEYGALAAAGFPPVKLAGLFFEDTLTGPFWWDVQKSVVELDAVTRLVEEDGSVSTSPTQGSAVVVSPEGHVLTADHVVRGELGFNSDLTIVADGVEYPVSVDDIVYDDPDADLAVLLVPELAGAPYARFAESRPEEGAPAFAFGFPGLTEEELSARGDVDARLMSVGTYVGTAVPDGTHTYDVLSLRLYPGDSGGAVFNADGELTDISHGIVPGKTSYASGIFDADTADPKLREALGDIRGLQERICDEDPLATCSNEPEPIECLP
jgi:hypothetical protein